MTIETKMNAPKGAADDVRAATAEMTAAPTTFSFLLAYWRL